MGAGKFINSPYIQHAPVRKESNYRRINSRELLITVSKFRPMINFQDRLPFERALSSRARRDGKVSDKFRREND